MTRARTLGLRIAAASAVLACWALTAAASEPVSSQHILGELIPINESAEYKVRSIDLDVPFTYDSAELTPQATRQLEELGKALASPQLDGATFGIHGHTDAKGAAGYNLALSDRRAQAVKAYLVNTAKIDAARLTAKGFGETQLKNAKSPQGAENRRVQILALTPPTRKEAPATPAPGAKPAGAISF